MTIKSLGELCYAPIIKYISDGKDITQKYERVLGFIGQAILVHMIEYKKELLKNTKIGEMRRRKSLAIEMNRFHPNCIASAFYRNETLFCNIMDISKSEKMKDEECTSFIEYIFNIIQIRVTFNSKKEEEKKKEQERIDKENARLSKIATVSRMDTHIDVLIDKIFAGDRYSASYYDWFTRGESYEEYKYKQIGMVYYPALNLWIYSKHKDVLNEHLPEYIARNWASPLTLESDSTLCKNTWKNLVDQGIINLEEYDTQTSPKEVKRTNEKVEIPVTDEEYERIERQRRELKEKQALEKKKRELEEIRKKREQEKKSKQNQQKKKK
jgi:hypothetical protein